MNNFQHPSHTVFIEGTYVVKNIRSNKYVYLSEHTAGEVLVLHEHKDILNKLQEWNIEDILEFSHMDNTYANAFMDA